MTRRARRNILAPASAAVVLAAIGFAGDLGAAPGPGEDYLAGVRAAIDGIPYRIGDWVGIDTEPPPAAVRMLKPNRILQRRYVDPQTGDGFTLLVVHCAETRDLLGHYPPVCYPAHGWEPAGTSERPLHLDGAQRPARLYGFTRTSGALAERLEVLNFFILPDPDASIVGGIERVERAGSGRAASRLGAAQVQVLGRGLSGRDDDLSQFLRAIEPVIAAIAKGDPT